MVDNIGQYGLKIKNIEASTLFEYNNGVRDHYEYKEAMFTNSLFLDFLLENGLKVWNDESTRDIICLEFNYGSRSYKKELEHLHKVANDAHKEYRVAKVRGDGHLKNRYYNKRKKISGLLETAHKNQNKYKPLTNEEIRTLYYNNGVDVEYITRDRNGNIKKTEKIHYKMLFRSTGKAKKGSCMFIRDKLYKKARKFLYMGIEPSEENPMIVELSAYAPLVSSGIVGRIKINPKNILILKDVDRFFRTNVISVETDKNKHCIAKRIDDYEIKNTIFDGQALIDSSIFPDWCNGYVLLRHHFCKMAAFSTNIQKFFKDYFGDDYYSATVEDMFGNIHYVKDIELVTTDNAMKWIKFDKSYDYWCEKVYENNCMFGIVKTAHESKLGSVQKMSYQMVNSLDNDIMKNVVQKSYDYIVELKTNDDVFLDYLRKNSNFSNDYDVLVALCEHNPDFIRSSYFRERRKNIIKVYVLNMKSGKIIQNADNLTLVGSPYAMLLYAATGKEDSVDKDDTFCFEQDTVQCYTERFDDRDYLALFRSPFNGKYNLVYAHNTYDDRFKKYFNFGEQIIAVNMIGTDVQDRANGCDMDSDFFYVTNQVDIVEHARQCYLKYPTIVNKIPKESNKYRNTMDDFALIDNNLSRSQTDIGESSNLAQIAQTYECNFEDQKFSDYVCVLSVLAQVAIDNSKRRFDIDLTEEIKRIKKDMDIKNHKYPAFWLIVKKGFSKTNINRDLVCPMNYLYNLNFNKYRNPTSTLPMSHFFIKHQLDINRRTCKRVEELISKYSLQLFAQNVSDAFSNESLDEYLLLRSDFEELVRNIRNVNISSNYVGLMSWLIDRAFTITPDVSRNKMLKTNLGTNKSLLLKVLYEVNPKCFLRCFSKKM